MTSRDFNSLLNRANVDDEAFAVLYEFLLPKLVWYVGYKFGTNVDAYDLSHDFFSLIKEGKFTEVKTKYPLAWAYKVTFNLATKYLRRFEKETTLDGVDEQTYSSDSADVVAVRIALDEMEEPQKTIVRLKGMYDVKFNEISEILDMNVSTVKTLYYRGLKELKEKLS